MRRPSVILQASFCALATAMLPFLSAALPYGTGTYGTCSYNTCAISLSTSGTVTLGVIPGSGDVYTIDKDVVTVTTAASTGYTLLLESATAQTELSGASATIAASSGTVASPVVLGSNTWGFRVDGQGGFGAGPTSAVSNATSSSLTFAGLSANGSPASLRSTAAAASAEITDVWYGVRVAPGLVADTYTRSVLYTATTN